MTATMTVESQTDKKLQRAVLDELEWEPSVNAAHVGVSVNNGIVTLTGHVPSYAEKYAAERAAKRVYGVAAVADELDVKLPGSSLRHDQDLAAACLSALKTNIAVPDEKIKVTVNAGWVQLEGEVEWQYQRVAAEKSVRYLTGVIGVRNDIVVKPHIKPLELKGKIEQAFRRGAQLDSDSISIAVNGNTVTLSGTVRSMAEKDEAIRLAWSAPGVAQVNDRISVRW